MMDDFYTILNNTINKYSLKTLENKIDLNVSIFHKKFVHE